MVDNLAGGDVSLFVGNNDATSEFDGTIQNSTGSLGLTKTGAGALTLGGFNSYIGGTYVTGGVLQIGASEALASEGDVVISGSTVSWPWAPCRPS